ncbi:MAG: IS3 family transposase [Atopobiaceae bacterium]|nr:IS3 family transposase [Atopobiaceae bacterium]
MYGRDDVELALYALDEGFSYQAAGELVGASREAVRAWARGQVPHERRVRRGRRGATIAPDVPDDEGGTVGREDMTPEEIDAALLENQLLRAVLADLKEGGWNPASTSNRRKAELGERLRRASGLPLRSITAFLGISKSSYEYHRARLGAPDPRAGLGAEVVRLFEAAGRARGYRYVWEELRGEGWRVSEKVVRRVMREEGCRVVYLRRRRRRPYSSYAGEISPAPANLVARDFHASEPGRLLLTDVTEFRLPGGRKVYLSPVVDCFDGMPASWSIGLHPDEDLVVSSLLGALARGTAAGVVVHTDRGARTGARRGSPHARRTAWSGPCRPRAAAGTTPPARASSAG